MNQVIAKTSQDELPFPQRTFTKPVKNASSEYPLYQPFAMGRRFAGLHKLLKSADEVLALVSEYRHECSENDATLAQISGAVAEGKAYSAHSALMIVTSAWFPHVVSCAGFLSIFNWLTLHVDSGDRGADYFTDSFVPSPHPHTISTPY